MAGRAVGASAGSARANIALGHALLLSGDSASAMGPLRLAVDRDPAETAGWELLCGAAVQSANSEASSRAAEDILRRASTSAPQSPLVAYYAGLFHLSRHRFADAERSFRRALALNPVYSDALFNLANTLAMAGRADESAAVRREFVRISDYSRAATDLQLRLHRDPERRDLWLRLLQLAEANCDEARTAYCRARLHELSVPRAPCHPAAAPPAR